MKTSTGWFAKAFVAGLHAGLCPSWSMACGKCAPLVRQDVFNADFPAHLCLLLAPLAVIVALAWAITRLDRFH